jgi:hypothetical protein
MKKLHDFTEEEKINCKRIMRLASNFEMLNRFLDKVTDSSIEERIIFVEKEFGIKIIGSNRFDEKDETRFEKAQYADYVAVLTTLADKHWRG